MLSANPKPSHGSGISQEPVIFTLHCIFVETKAQSAHVFFPGASAFEEFQHFGLSRFGERFPRGGAAELWSPDQTSDVSRCRCCQIQPHLYVPAKVWTLVFPSGVVGNV